ncbi:MAG: hypothetical protein SF339_13060 [Blastocatellia bacterium]|nr:hypothetical protein [Blastocatellia bacterium]
MKISLIGLTITLLVSVFHAQTGRPRMVGAFDEVREGDYTLEYGTTNKATAKITLARVGSTWKGRCISHSRVNTGCPLKIKKVEVKEWDVAIIADQNGFELTFWGTNFYDGISGQIEVKGVGIEGDFHAKLQKEIPSVSLPKAVGARIEEGVYEIRYGEHGQFTKKILLRRDGSGGDVGFERTDPDIVERLTIEGRKITIITQGKDSGGARGRWSVIFEGMRHINSNDISGVYGYGNGNGDKKEISRVEGRWTATPLKTERPTIALKAGRYSIKDANLDSKPPNIYLLLLGITIGNNGEILEFDTLPGWRGGAASWGKVSENTYQIMLTTQSRYFDDGRPILSPARVPGQTALCHISIENGRLFGRCSKIQ